MNFFNHGVAMVAMVTNQDNQGGLLSPVEGVIKSCYMVTRIKDIPVIIYMYCDDSIFLFHDFKVHVQIHQISLNH